MKTKKNFFRSRRKPQNLTPPLSSDGGSSSTSGQSPNSQHNGSPPPLIKRPSQTTSSLNNMNMNSSNLINEKYMEPVPKKPRISHYRTTTSSTKNPHHDSIDSIRLTSSYDNNRDASSFMMNSRSRDNDDFFG
jgi:RNA polymerase II elongation factor ELL